MTSYPFLPVYVVIELPLVKLAKNFGICFKKCTLDKTFFSSVVIKLATTMVITSNFRQPRKVVIQKRTLRNVLATLSIFDDIKRSNWPPSNLSKLLMKKLLNQPLQWPMPWQVNPCTILIRNPWNSFTNIGKSN